MLINIQFKEADELLRELLREVPDNRCAAFAKRVNRVASELYHPDLSGAVLVPVSGDDAHKSTTPLTGIVLPLERAEVA